MIEILPFGDSALLVNFEQEISETTNHKVIALFSALENHPAVKYLIPAYCSLTVGFDSSSISFQKLSEQITALNSENQPRENTNSKLITIPVCYDISLAPDLEEVSTQTGLTPEGIINKHTESTFQVYMLGFVAGFAYLGRLPNELFCQRRKEPRKQVEAGSVGLAGLQTGIYPTEAPGGWQIIGRTPILTFNPKNENPSLFQPGDTVKFKAISLEEFNEIKAADEAETFNHSTLYG